MQTHRFFLMVLAFCAMMGISAGEGQAGAVTLTVATNGKTFKLTGNGTFGADVAALNKDLTAAGSAYQFDILVVETIAKPGIGSLDVGGKVTLGNAGTDGPLTLTATEGGFSQPQTKTGTMYEVVNGKFSGANATDSIFATGIYNSAPSLGAGPLLGNLNMKFQKQSTSTTISPLVTPYSLTESVTITLSKPKAILGFQGIVSVVPEPSGLILLVTGLLASAGTTVIESRRRGICRSPGGRGLAQ